MPGYRLQTNCEELVELKTSIDVFATYEFCELPAQPGFALVPGPAASWKAIWPSLAVVGEPFRLAIVAEDKWGNPTTEVGQKLTLVPSRPVRGLPQSVGTKPGDGPRIFENLIADEPGDIDLALVADGKEVAHANPLRVVTASPLRRYWGDLHGQSGETIGMGSAESYFRYTGDKAFIDMVGHQGNDFQITDAFWAELNRLTAEFDAPGRFLCLPGYEWSGNTGMGGDRNIFLRQEGRPIRRSSHILVEGQTSTDAIYTADELFRALEGEDAVVIAHVGVKKLPPAFPGSDGVRRHADERVPGCDGADLSVPADHDGRRVRSRRTIRHHRPHLWPRACGDRWANLWSSKMWLVFPVPSAWAVWRGQSPDGYTLVLGNWATHG